MVQIAEVSAPGSVSRVRCRHFCHSGNEARSRLSVVLPGCEFGGFVFYPLEDGSKVQGRLDLKGAARAIPQENMPWIRYADGTKVRAEIVMPLDSRGHA